MPRRTFSLLTTSLFTAAIAIGGCKNVAAPAPTLGDIDVARARWLANRPASYGFEEAVTGQAGKFGYYKIIVVDQKIALVLDEGGNRISPSWVLSIDSLWSRITSERAAGALNSAVFSEEGVPLAADWGRWELDGGVAYVVRNFGRK